VATYVNNIDAEMDRLTLEAKGLKVWIFNQCGSQAGPYASVQLQVPKEDYGAALQILEPELSELVPSSDLPAEMPNRHVPNAAPEKSRECGCKGILGYPLAVGTELLYYCASCGYKWAQSSES